MNTPPSISPASARRRNDATFTRSTAFARVQITGPLKRPNAAALRPKRQRRDVRFCFVAARIFLMFDYTSSGLWHSSVDGSGRANGMVDPDSLPISREIKDRLAAWVTACDELNMR